MLIQEWGEVLGLSLQNLWGGLVEFIPKLIVALIFFIVGWVIGSIIGKAIMQLLSAMKVDKVFKGTGADEALAKSGLQLNISAFIGGIVKWFIIVVFLMASLEVIGLTQVNDFLRDVVLGYLPQVLIAAFVLILATIIADTVKTIVISGAKAMNVKSANLLGTISKYAIWIFAIIIALSELGIASQFMQVLFTGIIAMLALAGGLAFGLGGKEAASRSIDRLHREISNRNE